MIENPISPIHAGVTEYSSRLNMSYEELDSIINQANELGTYLFLYFSGEPRSLPPIKRSSPEMRTIFVPVRSTDLQSPENVRDLAAKCREAAENWASASDKTIQ